MGFTTMVTCDRRVSSVLSLDWMSEAGTGLELLQSPVETGSGKDSEVTKTLRFL